MALVLLPLFYSTIAYANPIVYAVGTGTLDKFGITEIYPTKSGGEQWFMNMNDPNHDTKSNPPTLTKNPDGSWKSTDTQVRYEVFTSTGYKPSLIKTYNEKNLDSKGYMQSPNDWKNTEITGIVKFNSGDSTGQWTWYSRGGKHTTSTPCEGTSLKESLFFAGEKTRVAKEQWHVSYVFAKAKPNPTSASSIGHFVGFKAIMYNFIHNGKKAVNMEIWLDPSLKNNWKKVNSFTDSGGFGSSAKKCGGSPDQIITWGGSISTFRWDNANNVDIKDFSVREIVPPRL